MFVASDGLPDGGAFRYSGLCGWFGFWVFVPLINCFDINDFHVWGMMVLDARCEIRMMIIMASEGSRAALLEKNEYRATNEQRNNQRIRVEPKRAEKYCHSQRGDEKVDAKTERKRRRQLTFGLEEKR
ncbi:hypothetical protein CC80DRAFT_265318 [Byssothecium circinans]|uniref:Uncharacterized protein n=1 Tax=Byssothecium circinans TaxID=147558 RepID=A0A6A5UID2_9PLEO|nr:hypothetical protein CC80DRAFT_265318 [Byssothecium circinans]